MIIFKTKELILFTRNIERIFMHSSQKVINQPELYQLDYLNIRLGKSLLIELDELFSCYGFIEL